ncbi:hypothetical protein [Corynebacterium mastitidis]|nr:hypothetical protein [Corynebacterium mastitidis]MDK8451171.1 hypothetical protein [Corynebacterium mastitidis]
MIDEFTGEHGGFQVTRLITATAVSDLLENFSRCARRQAGGVAYG